jgi:hypothetical protein
MRRSSVAMAAGLLLLLCTSAQSQFEWKAEVLPVTLQVGYAVRAADMNGDEKLDIVIVDSKRILWLENPSWQTHEIYSTPDAPFDNVCIAIHDIDGDGRLDMALGSDWQFGNSDSGGKIGLLFAPEDPAQPWNYRQIDTEPTTHRMSWGDLDGNGRKELIIAPLKGRGTRPPELTQTGVRLLCYNIPDNPRQGAWKAEVLTDQLKVMHNLDVLDLNHDGRDEIVAASFEGVTVVQRDPDRQIKLRRIGSGQSGNPPAIGSSEIKMWNDAKSPTRFAATIEPWHGDKVVVYSEPLPPTSASDNSLWPRVVVDAELKWGHAVAWSDFEGDKLPELIAGVRDDQNAEHRCGVRLYHYLDGKWQRQLIEPGQVAVEDLITADLDRDGTDEIIAVGRATHNAVIYRKK